MFYSPFAILIWCGIVGSVAGTAVAADVDVQVLFTDDHLLTGSWVGSTDGRSIELRRADTVETIPLDELAGITFKGVDQSRAQRDPERDQGGSVKGSVAVRPVKTPRAGDWGSVKWGRDDNPDGESTGDQSPPPTSAVFHLADGGHLLGELMDPLQIQKADAVFGRTALGDPTALPFDRLAGIQLADGAEFPRAYEVFRSALGDRLPGQDLLITRGVDGVKTLRGRLEEMGVEQGSFAFGGRTRTFRTERIFGVVFARGPDELNSEPRVSTSAHRYPVTLTLVNGSVFSGELKQADAESIRIAASLGLTVDLKLADVVNLRIFSDRVVYLSDLEPAAVHVEGLLHRPWPVRWNRSVSGGPLLIDGRTFEKGIGVHSKAELTFKIGGDYEKFVATIGIDDAVRPHGSVIFRLLADGKTLFESGELTGWNGSQHVIVDVSSVKVLTLVVDYGGALDLADHADWGGARLIKPAPPTN